MFFNALVRKFRGLQSMKDDADFISFKALMKQKMDRDTDSLPAYGYPFSGQRLLRLKWAPPHLAENRFQAKMTDEESSVLGRLLPKIHSVFNEPHKVLFVQLVTFDPTNKILIHYDNRDYFPYVKRLNLILDKAGMTYYCFNGKTAQRELTIEDGDLFELNVSAYHSVEIKGNEYGQILIVDYIEESAPDLPEDCLLKDTENITERSLNLPFLIWDYS